MKLSDHMKAKIAFVEKELTGMVICERCKCTLDTYADQCNADLSDACPGFMAIEASRGKFQCLTNRNPVQ